MSNYTIDNDVIIDIYRSNFRSLATGFDSIYSSVVHPGSNRMIQGWQWDKRTWPTKKELEALQYSPSIWDPVSNFLGDDYWQSGVGNNKDLLLLGILEFYYNNLRKWIPKVNHGYFYRYEDEYYLFSDDYLTENFYNNQTYSGLQYVNLSHRPKVGIPVKARRYRYDKSNQRYDIDLDFRKRAHFTGRLDEDNVELDTLNDDGNVSFENVHSGSPEFIVDYNNQKVWLNDDYSESIADSGDFQNYELLGVGDGYRNKFFTKYSPIDPSGYFEVATYIASGFYITWNQIDSLSDFTQDGSYEYKLDPILGTVSFGNYDGITGSGLVPALGNKVITRYTKGVVLEYEPQYSRDYIFGFNADINPFHTSFEDGFLSVGLDNEVPASIVLSCDLGQNLSDQYQVNINGSVGKVTATVKSNKNNLLSRQIVYFENIEPATGAISPVTTLTNVDGEAYSYISSPSDIDDIGYLTTDITHSGSDSIINVSGLRELTNESGVLLFGIAREDLVLATPSSGENNYYLDFLNGNGIYVNPSTIDAQTQSGIDFEKSYRQQFGITGVNFIDDTDTDTLGVGRKEVIYTNNPSHIHPHSGSQYNPTYSPIFPTKYSSVGTSSSPEMELVYNELIEPLNNEYKSFMVAAEALDYIRAYVINPLTGQRIYSNILEVNIGFGDSFDGIINCEDSNDVPSGLFREARNINHYTDDWIVDVTSGCLFDTYLEKRLASGEAGYKELSVEDKTVALYHLNGDFEDEGFYGLVASGDSSYFAEKSKYSDQAFYLTSSGEDVGVNNITDFFPYTSGTLEFAYRTPYHDYYIQTGSPQYLCSLLSINSGNQYNGIESFFYIESGISYLGMDYLSNDYSLFDTDPIAMSVALSDTNLMDGYWHQIKATWKYTPDEVVVDSGFLDFSCYVDNVQKASRQNVWIPEPDVNGLDELGWERQNPSFISYDNDFYSVAYGGGIFTTVGEYGAIQTSVNGSSWTGGKTSTFSLLFDIVYGNGLYVAVGQSGEIQISSNGVDWIRRVAANAYGNHFYSVTYGNNLYVAVGGSSGIQTSSNGSSWVARTAAGGLATFYGVTYGNSLYVAVGQSGKINTSSDGITWTSRTPDAGWGNFQDVTYGNGLYVAVGSSASIQTSPDGTTWTARTAGGGFGATFYSVTYGNGLYVAVGSSGEIQTSPDGTTWTARTAGGGYVDHFRGVTYDNGIFVAVGLDGEIQTSSNGINWIHRDKGETIYSLALYDIVYGNSLHVAVGVVYAITGASGGIQTSPDGKAWTTSVIDGAFLTNLHDVIYGDNLFVIVGEGGEIQTSPDGTTWTARTAGGGFGDNFHAVSYGSNIYVAVGSSGEIQTSSNGINWTHRVSDGGFSGIFYDITYGNNLFVTVGESEIQTSTDGISWVTRELSNSYSGTFYGVTYGSGLYVAVGSNGEIQTSSDGVTWMTRVADRGYIESFLSVTYGDGLFVAVGESGEIQISSDGITWTKSELVDLFYSTFYSVVYNGSFFIAVGSGGEIQTSFPRFENIVGKRKETASLGYYDEIRLTSGENITSHTFQPWYYLDFESYEDWFRRVRLLDSKHLGLNTYLYSDGCPSTVPVGFRLKSTDTDVASTIGYRTFLDLNDSLSSDYYLASGLDIYERYY